MIWSLRSARKFMRVRCVYNQHYLNVFFKSSAVIPYGSFGGGLNVIGK